MGGYDGELTLVGAEAALPYQRPPLSKAYMKGEFAEERLYFKPAAWYEDNNVDLVLSTRATAINRADRTVEIEHGGKLDYDALIIATGSRPRNLPIEGANLEHVYALRDLADVERIRPQMSMQAAEALGNDARAAAAGRVNVRTWPDRALVALGIDPDQAPTAPAAEEE